MTAAAACSCVSDAARTMFAVYYPLDGEIIDASTTMHMPVLEELTATTDAMNIAFEGMFEGSLLRTLLLFRRETVEVVIYVASIRPRI